VSTAAEFYANKDETNLDETDDDEDADGDSDGNDVELN